MASLINVIRLITIIKLFSILLSMDTKYQEFVKFNFEASPDWKKFLSSIDPPPSGIQIQNLKKKFYKRQIDNNFDLSFVPSAYTFNRNEVPNSNPNPSSGQNQSQQNSSSNNSSAQPTSSSGTQSTSNSMFYVAEIFFYLYFLVKLVISSENVFIYSFYGLATRILRLNWPISFSKEFLSRIITQEAFSYLIYSLIMSISNGDKKVLVFLVPTLMTCIIYISGFQRRNSSQMPAAINKGFDKIRSYQDSCIKIRSVFEIAILPVAVLGIFLGFNSFILPIFYFQFLKMRLSVDNKLSASLNEVKSTINSIAQQTQIEILKTILFKLASLSDYLR